MTTRDQEQATTTTTVMSVHDLRGRPVWTQSGERLGVVRDVQLGPDGQVEALHVRERWMFGHQHEVSAAGMRIDQGDVIVPDTALRKDVEESATGTVAPAPARSTVLLAGRDGARGRFGGLDIVGSLFGALVAIGALVVVGGLLAAIFGTDALVIDTGYDTFALVTDETMLVGAVTVFVAFLLGGWCAGRSARFDGVANGLVTVLWVLVIGVVFGALGAGLGDEYDVYVEMDLPSFVTDDFSVWGSAAFVVAFVLMLVAGALGGALGESWHRRADRAMLDVVAVDDGADAATGHVGSPVEDRPHDAERRPRVE